MREKQEIKLTVKKIDMHAQNSYQLKRLTDTNFYFVPCAVEETSDEIEFTFDITGMMPAREARKSSGSVRYGLLVQLLEAILANPQFCFSLAPENLYLDQHGRIRVLVRDFVGGEHEAPPVLPDVKALAGYLFQKKFTFEDYKNGGLELLKRQKKTSYLFDISELQVAEEIFRERQEENREKELSEMTVVNRSSYHAKLALLVLAAIAGVGMLALIIYQNFYILNPQKSALMAERAFLESDLTAVADAMRPIPADRMDTHEKYILAVSYIRGQSVDSFDASTKERLVSRLSYNGDENLLDYWIYLGRLQIEDALDVAMRLSDNQLLLYAYLQKLEQVTADAALNGEEKAAQMDSVKSKIKSLADELGIEYKDNQTGGEQGQ